MFSFSQFSPGIVGPPSYQLQVSSFLKRVIRQLSQQCLEIRSWGGGPGAALVSLKLSSDYKV